MTLSRPTRPTHITANETIPFFSTGRVVSVECMCRLFFTLLRQLPCPGSVSCASVSVGCTRAFGSSFSLETPSCGKWDLVPQPEMEPGPPALGTWSLSPCSLDRQGSPYLLVLLTVFLLAPQVSHRGSAERAAP